MAAERGELPTESLSHIEAGRPGSRRAQPADAPHARSKRSASITLVHAATKSRTKRSRLSSCA